MVVDILNLILLEKKIILLCDSISLLTYCAEGLRTLLYPFQFPLMFAFVPHLPVQLLETILSPVPYLVGAHSSLRKEVFAVIDQQNRMFEQTSKQLQKVKILQSDNNDITEYAHDESLVVIDMNTNKFLYGKSPEGGQRFPEPYRSDLINGIKNSLRPTFKNYDFLDGSYLSTQEQIHSIDTRIREIFLVFYCKLLQPLSIHILTHKWSKLHKRSDADFLETVHHYIKEELEDINVQLKEFIINLFPNQIFSELLSHGMEEQYLFQELAFSIFNKSECEGILKMRNLLPNRKQTTEDILQFSLISDEDVFNKFTHPYDALLFWIDYKMEKSNEKDETLSYTLARLFLMRSLVYEKMEKFLESLEDALDCLAISNDERLIKREWFESLILRIPKQVLSRHVVRLKTKYPQSIEDIQKQLFLEKIVGQMHQSHVQEVKTLFEKPKSLEEANRNSDTYTYDNKHAEDTNDYLLEVGDLNQTLATSCPEESFFDEDSDNETVPLTPAKDNTLTIPITKRKSTSTPSFQELEYPETDVSTPNNSSTQSPVLLSLPFINFSMIEQQLIPSNIKSISPTTNSKGRRRSSSLFKKKKTLDEFDIVKSIGIPKDLFSMVSFECGMFFSKQDAEKVYDQLVEFQNREILENQEEKLSPETLKKFLNTFKIVNQFNQYSTLRLKKVQITEIDDDKFFVILTQSTLCELSISYSSFGEGTDDISHDSLGHVRNVGRICFCNDGSIYFGISKLELLIHDMTQILKIDHHPPQSALNKSKQIGPGTVRIVIKNKESNGPLALKTIELHFPTTTQSVVWYGHFLGLMNFTTSMAMINMIKNKKTSLVSPTSSTTVSIFRSITIDHVMYLLNQIREQVR